MARDVVMGIVEAVVRSAAAKPELDGFISPEVRADSVPDPSLAPIAEDDDERQETEESDDCYQAHFLEDDEPETDYVAHIEPAEDRPAIPAEALADRIAKDEKSPAAIVKLAGRDALTAALMGIEPAAEEPEIQPAPAAEVMAPADVPGMGSDELIAPPAVQIGGVEAIADHAITYHDAARPPLVDTDDAGPSPYADIAANQGARSTFVADSDDLPPSEESPELAAELFASDETETVAGSLDYADVATTTATVEAVPYAFEDEGAAALEEDRPAVTGGGWTIPLLCLGIAIIAFCLVIPQADANRRLAYERSSLRADLESIQAQVATNDEFLRKLASDPTLAERLAQRQLNLQRAGTKALAIGLRDNGTSPFDLVKVPPPPAVEPYEPVGGKLAAICRNGHSRLYLMGAGLFVLAAGLVLGASPPRR